MIDPEAQFDQVISWLVEARDMPQASTPETHINRSDRRNELLHLASETIILDLVQHVREEGDVFRRFRSETA